MKTQNWITETDDHGVVWLCLDTVDSKVNVLSSTILLELEQVLDKMTENPPSGLVLWSGKDRSFVMGADIKEFSSVDTIERAEEVVGLGQKLINKVEELRCPTVAVVNGYCLGGGLELAMACDYRIAFAGDKKILGLPEVKLGLHPGFGGTVRTVQICGVRAAMQLMLTGNPIAPGKAKSIGLVDKLTNDKDWRADADTIIKAAPAKQTAPFADRMLNLAIARPIVRSMLLKQVQIGRAHV